MEEGFDIQINCGQGQIDQDHVVTVTVTNGQKTYDVTQFLPAQGTIDDISRGLATKIGKKIGDPVHVTSTGRLTRELHLPSNWAVTSVQTEKKASKKWKERKGHLSVRGAKKKVPTPQPGVGFSAFSLVLSESNADPIAIDLMVHASRPSGSTQRVNYQVTYPVGTTGAEALAEVGDFLVSALGCSAQMIDDQTLAVTPNNSIAAIYVVYFGAFEDNDHDSINDPYTLLPPWRTTTSIIVTP